MVGVERQRLWTKFVWVFNGTVAGGAIFVVEDENPDDAAIGKTGIGVILLLPWIFHAQL